MTNKEALKNLCNAICNTFYPDDKTMEMMLWNEGMVGDDTATPKDQAILKIAVKLVLGYVETSRSENGISTSVNRDAVDNSIKIWCREYGLDVSEVMEATVIEDISNIW